MPSTAENNCPRYVEEAIDSINQFMLNNQNNMIDNINRTNKGELFVLHFLSARNTEALPSELSAALQSSSARISALLGALEKKGEIKREIDPEDRRNILVTITAAGRGRIKTELKEIHGFMAQIFTEMGEADTIEFVRLVKRFSALAQKHMFAAEGCIGPIKR